jgi:hypothetical protein
MYFNNPYSRTGRHIIGKPSDKDRLLTSTIDALHSLLCQIDNSTVWTAGSASVVRLQCALKSSEPILYKNVITDMYDGTFQPFLTDSGLFNLFFYNAADIEAYPALGRLISPQECRCSMLRKDAAVLLDFHIAQHWTEYFVSFELPLIAMEVLKTDLNVSSGATQCEVTQRTGSGRKNRHQAAAILRACDVHYPFSRLISRNKLRETAQAALWRAAEAAHAKDVSCVCCDTPNASAAYVNSSSG